MDQENHLQSNQEILIAEDSPVQGTMLRRILTQHGYKATLVKNGQDALTKLRERAFGLVISDVAMPVMNGYEMCSAIKGDSNIQDIPVMLLTTLAMLLSGSAAYRDGKRWGSRNVFDCSRWRADDSTRRTKLRRVRHAQARHRTGSSLANSPTKQHRLHTDFYRVHIKNREGRSSWTRKITFKAIKRF